MLYSTLDFVPDYTFIMLYFFYGSVNYGINVCGTVDQSKKHEVEIKINYLEQKLSYISYLFHNLNLLKLNAIYRF